MNPLVTRLCALALVACAGRSQADANTIGFEDLILEPESAWRGPDPDGSTIDGFYGRERIGEFRSGEVAFQNIYDLTNLSWRSFAYSNVSEAIPGVAGQFSSAAGGGRGGGNDNFAVAYGYHDPIETNLPFPPFDPNNTDHLNDLPTLELPAGRNATSLWVTNSGYAADTMIRGNTFAKRFGGESGTDPDWFKVTAYGSDESGAAMGIAVEFYLADYRAIDSAEDYVLTDWAEWDLSSLAGARRVHFNLTSSDTGISGMNTPAYFVIDDLTLEPTVVSGDYNRDGRVDAADYTVWRDTLGESVDWRGSGADGDLSGTIDAGDLAVWQANYGSVLAPPLSVPEPSGSVLFFLTCILGVASKARSRVLGSRDALTWISDS